MSDEAAKLAKLAALSPPTASLEPVIAVDLDDVLSQTNLKVAQCQLFCPFEAKTGLIKSRCCIGHNEKYGTQMDLSTFYCKLFPCH
jgi:hypothetical protein